MIEIHFLKANLCCIAWSRQQEYDTMVTQGFEVQEKLFSQILGFRHFAKNGLKGFLWRRVSGCH